MKMKGAIFDVDGTLLDSMSAWCDVMVKFFEKNNLPLSEKKAEEYQQMRLEDSLAEIIDEFKLNLTAEEIIDEFRRLMVVEYKENIQLKSHAKEYLEKLHKDGVKIAIATSGYEELCKSAFERLGVWQYIDEKAFSSEVGVDKGHPDVYLLAAKKLGLDPNECIVFEDIIRGLNGAKKGGFKTCAVKDNSNISDTEELIKTADIYISDFSELIDGTVKF